MYLSNDKVKESSSLLQRYYMYMYNARPTFFCLGTGTPSGSDWLEFKRKE